SFSLFSCCRFLAFSFLLNVSCDLPIDDFKLNTAVRVKGFSMICKLGWGAKTKGNNMALFAKIQNKWRITKAGGHRRIGGLLLSLATDRGHGSNPAEKVMERKKIIIIGVTSGIGRALADVFAAGGHVVGITGRREALLHEILATRPASYHISALDVTDTAAIIMRLEALAAAMGGVDMIVISAGGGDTNAALDFAVEQRMIHLNVQAFTQVANLAFNYFRDRKGGHLAAITSVAGMRGSRQAPGYSASKRS